MSEVLNTPMSEADAKQSRFVDLDEETCRVGKKNSATSRHLSRNRPLLNCSYKYSNLLTGYFSTLHL